MILRTWAVLFFLCCGTFVAFSQERCGTVQYNNALKKSGRIPASDHVFENWLAKKMSTLRAASASRKQTGPYKIPVVVHVIHNGENIGSGTNISDAQIISQISVINADFRRTNADASQTPGVFVPLAGNLDIQFVLAKQDPEGLATNGIMRVKGSKTGWVYEDSYELKAQSYWPAEDYLNIWVCDMVDDLVGHAQYPESTLPGIDQSSINRLTDGVAIWYRAFGSSDDGNFNLSAPYTKGRTLTHELGHFFGLRHIWGDDTGACTGDDFVSDTPNQGGSSSGCPTHPKSSCGTVNMFQNYMDYTGDVCMNLFTKEQITRMTTVLENSPRRVSLLTSQGFNEPLSLATDLGIRSIVSPTESNCTNTLEPSVEVRNYGTNPITSAKIQVILNGIPGETVDVNLNLATLQTAVVNFTPVNISSGNNEISFQILEVDAVADQNSSNNSSEVAFATPDSESTPFNEPFNSFPTNWTIKNPDARKTWELVTAPRESPSNKAMRLNFFDYDESFGEVDMLISPVFDLTTAPVASIVFDVAYTRYLSSNDQLKVVVISDCQNVEDGEIIFEKIGTSLRTTNSTSGSFVPTSVDQWRREFINISKFAGNPHIQLAFVSVSDWGNNLYLDNVSILTSELEDVELQEIISPSFITCNPNPAPTLVVQNVGTQIISSLTIEYSVNGLKNQFTVSDLNLSLGDQGQIQLPLINLTKPQNELVVTLLNPNGVADQTPINNSKTFTMLLDASTERIPARQNFNSGFDSWKSLTPEGGDAWEIVNTNFSGSSYYNAYSNTSINEMSWLISPVLDFSGATEASVVFDYSYRSRVGRVESLRFFASTDCGENFSEIATIPLPAEEFESAWVPFDEADWITDFVVDLSAYAGEQNVRVAFGVVNDNANNLYLDNVEFFTAADPVLIAAATPYNLYGYNLESPASSSLQLTFNLEQQSEVRYSIVDMMGKTVASAVLSDVLNQTYKIDQAGELTSGTYLLRLQIGYQHFSNRFLIVR